MRNKELEADIVKRFNKVSFRDVRAKLLNTTNPMFKPFEGLKSRIDLIPLQCSFGVFSTSFISKMVMDKSHLIIKTRNSTYEFKILESDIVEKYQGAFFELNDIEKNYVESIKI